MEVTFSQKNIMCSACSVFNIGAEAVYIFAKKYAFSENIIKLRKRMRVRLQAEVCLNTQINAFERRATYQLFPPKNTSMPTIKE